MISYDFCLAWDWAEDYEFVQLIEEACRKQGVSLLMVTPANLKPVMESLRKGETTFRAFFDRASDTDPAFNSIVCWAKDNNVYRINPFELASRAQDKAVMHLELINAGVYTPYTIILPSFEEQPDLPPADLTPLKGPFAIKPAHGGGGEGVILQANSWHEVVVSRMHYPKDKYLLQASIDSVALGSRTAWFRIIYCAGEIYPSWWDPSTRIYAPLSSEEEDLYQLFSLRDVTATLASVCGLKLFSTEIALTSEHLFVVVDYINDQIDLRLQSQAADGVPDHIVKDIAKRLIALVAEHCLSLV